MARSDLSWHGILVHRLRLVPRAAQSSCIVSIPGGLNEAIAVCASVCLLLSEGVDCTLRKWHGLYLSQIWPGRSRCDDRIGGAMASQEIPRAPRRGADLRGIERHHRASRNPLFGSR